MNDFQTPQFGQGTTRVAGMEHKSNPNRYSAKNSLRPINFFFAAPRAKSVQLVGDFNAWHPFPMHRQIDGWWYIQVMLPHGHHQYRFMVDGRPMLDPQASGVARDERNDQVSIIAVS